jgi:hypothetical protein
MKFIRQGLSDTFYISFYLSSFKNKLVGENYSHQIFQNKGGQTKAFVASNQVLVNFEAVSITSEMHGTFI